MKLVLLSSMAAAAYACCPNGCNGHGACGTSDVCECYKGFFGGDCSNRHCPEGPSWTVTPKANLLDDRYSEWITLHTPGGYAGATSTDSDSETYPLVEGDIKSTFEKLYPQKPSFNQYTECSSRGVCDYATGECKCFEGFEGRGCRRTTCPSDCSGHGRCLQNNEINSKYTSYNFQNDQMWDYKRTQSCVCDRGFTGYDCSERMCPFGDDPTTNCGENSAGDVQLVHVTGDATEYFTLTFTDMFNGEYTTRPIKHGGCACEEDDDGNCLSTPCPEVQYALMDLPNFAIPEVEVDILNIANDDDGNLAESMYLVFFTDASNSGKQNTMSCENIVKSNVPGAQPLYKQVTSCAVYNVGGPEWFDDSGAKIEDVKISDAFAEEDIVTVLGSVRASAITSGTTYEDFQPCSSKGDCDASTGTCTCLPGHYGEGCEKQSTFY
jgi:hypothetical protein